MGRALGAHITKAPSTALGVAKGMAIGALALVLTLDASVQEFVELIAFAMSSSASAAEAALSGMRRAMAPQNA